MHQTRQAKPLQKEVVGQFAFCENMPIMFYRTIDKFVDKLPTWVKFVLMVLTILLSAYCIAKYGFWSFLLKVIFSP